MKKESERKRIIRFKYLKDYRSKIKKRSMSTMDIYEPKYEAIREAEYGSFNGLLEEVCSTFGCRKILSLREQMFGSICVNCSGNKKFDYNKILNK